MEDKNENVMSESMENTALVPMEGQRETSEEETCQGESAAEIRLQPIVPSVIRSYSAAGFIHISRNATTFVSKEKMTAAQVNLLIAIIEAIKKYMVYGSAYPFQDSTEVEVKIHWDVISYRHGPKDTMESLLSLMNMKLVYYYAFKGMARTGVANLISSVEYDDGYYYVRIPSKALPWYLYCGQDVGFARIERHVFYAIRSVPEKLLYLKLMSVVDREKQIGYWEAPVSELRDVMNLGAGTAISRMMSRFVRPLVEELNSLRSIYSIEADLIKDTNHKGRGHPSFTGVMFTVEISRGASANLFKEAHYLLSSCWDEWGRRAKGTPLSAATIAQLLEQEDRLGEFMRKCLRVSEVIRKKVEKEGNGDTPEYRLHMARAVAKILRDDYGINVFQIKKY